MLIQQVLAFLLACTLTTGGASGTAIQDVPQDDWSYPYVSSLVERDIMHTTGTGDFLGQVAINRGDFLLCLWRAAGSPSGGSAAFSDVQPGHRVYDALAWAVQQGIVEDSPGVPFSPAAYLDREEALTLLGLALPALGAESVAAPDGSSIQQAGGPSDSGGPLTRKEAAALLYETMELAGMIPGAGAPTVPAILPQEGWSWFDDAVFVGDSVSLKLTGYVTKTRQSDPEYLGKAQFLTAGSLGSGNALWEVSDKSVHPLYQGTKMRLEDSVHACGAKKLYILLGMNDVGLYGVDGAAANMETLLQLIREKTPDLEIFVQSATPIHRGNEKKVLNNANLLLYNEKLREMCDRNGYHYVDIASVLSDSEGFLPDAYCSDASGMGMHFTDEACRIWVDYLRQDAAARQQG